MIVAALLASLTTCSVVGEKDLYRTNEAGWHETGEWIKLEYGGL